jgi:hypothetical protein
VGERANPDKTRNEIFVIYNKNVISCYFVLFFTYQKNKNVILTIGL